jgi:hypothetical protein
MAHGFILTEIQEKVRLWESDKEKYYESILALMFYHPKCEVHLDQLKLLVSKESRRETTQYYLKIWSNNKQVQITNYPHPYPQLALLQKTNNKIPPGGWC